MENVLVNVGKIAIPTYREPAAEEMPMFSENRVHQRTSGRPYPNHVVLEVDREHREEKEYECITLENKYIKIEILPEIGGRIYSAYDKTTGYDFFYKQHVIKPALIGCLGSWVSGGVEFNWPFHHRASTFMPVDYYIENEADGGAIVWLSEHDPIERMKGMVGVCLKPDSAIFETRMKLCNRTPVTSTFLWWENAAVPVNKQYQIFYPQDVSYVRFHYKRSVTTFPVASNATGVFNGIRYDGPTDISMHKNTIQPTSYFSADSKYDFFGGYDHGKNCGVVHVANHHTAPGKKMFTWAYNQLSRSWEKALTDTDGAYAELMAGSFSDNQPDFAWIEPYETKNFSQFWYPIGALGIPVFANLNGALSWNEEKLAIQPTTEIGDVTVTVTDKEGNTVVSEKANLMPGKQFVLNGNYFKTGNKVSVTDSDGKELMAYEIEVKEVYNIPKTTEDMPNFKKVQTAQELYMEGVHVFQYRDPAILPDSYWLEAIKRDPEHYPSLLALADFYYRRAEYETALCYANRGLDALTHYNKRTPTGEAYFKIGLILNKMGDTDKAYDNFWKASWNMDYYAAAMTHIAAIDSKRGDFDKMEEHSNNAIMYNAQNPVALVYNAIASCKLGKKDEAAEKIEKILKSDPLNHLARFMFARLGKMTEKEFYAGLNSDPSQTCLDLAFNLCDAGPCDIAKELLKGLADNADYVSPMVYYVLGDFEKAQKTELKSSFAFRLEEKKVLLKAIAENEKDAKAWYYYGCLEYDKNQYKLAEEAFKKSIDADPSFYIPYRNLAALYFSHLDRKDEVLALLKKALELHPMDQQLVFETVYVMGKLGVDPEERIEFLKKNTSDKMRDDIYLEWARAYNQSNQPEKALELLLSHTFVPCEGGEHANAEQYMFAHHLMGRKLYKEGKFEEALKHFEDAQVIPDSLGAGLWNECRLVPQQFYQAKCLDKLGREKEAVEIYKHILCLKIDYFSEMHLRELPYYQALSYVRLGEELEGRFLINNYFRDWTLAVKSEDPGYFGTTPFFISYIDKPEEAREAYYRYLVGFTKRYMGDLKGAEKDFAAASMLDPSNLNYMLEKEFN